MESFLEIFLGNTWIRAASMRPGAQPYTARFDYTTEYVFMEGAQPVSLALPVKGRFTVDESPPPCPAFLLDLVPQGGGRRFLLGELGWTDGDHQHLPLAQHGAFNPVGNLRFDTAVQFHRDHIAKTTPEGITLEAMTTNRQRFLEQAYTHNLWASGTTGLQGESPKFLLTQADDGFWYSDALLEDARAQAHWLVKLPRGRDTSDADILRNEAAYLRVAAQCGLRVLPGAEHRHDMLFVPRFDRARTPAGIHRLHQESLAALTETRGFGVPISLFKMVAAIDRHASNPVEEVVEFMRRDVLNLAMGNTDNHGRNTAMQIALDGRVQLTPVFDFAPMYLDREGIARSCRWRNPGETEISAWEGIIEALPVRDEDRVPIAQGLVDFLKVIDNLEDVMRDCGVDGVIIEHCKPRIEDERKRLARIPLHRGNSDRGQAPKRK